MKQERKTYKDYGDRIYNELIESNPEKYKHITKSSINNHLKHIDYCIVSILSAESSEFISPFFHLIRGFRRYRNAKKTGRIIRRKYYNERQKELAALVPMDNVADRLNIITCLFRSNWEGKIFEKDTYYYKWNRLSIFDVKKRMNK
jgi:hypothetical protein